MPLVSSFVLSSKKGKEAIVAPVVEGGDYRFTVKAGDVSREEWANAKEGTVGRARWPLPADGNTHDP